MSERRVLLVEDNPADAEFVQAMLETSTAGPFVVTRVERLSAARQALEAKDYSIVLLDLRLPDSHGIATLDAVRRAAAAAAIVVFTGNQDEALVAEALAHGAQDYVQKNEVDASLLDRVLRYATHRIRTQRQLQEQQLELAEAQRLAHVGTWHTDLATGRSTWSDEAYRLLGYEPGQIEATAGAFMDHVHPEDRERIAAFPERPPPDGEENATTYRIVRRDGKLRWLESRVSILKDNEGRPVALRGTAQDVTERVNSEKARAIAAEQAFQIRKLKEIDELKTLFLNTAAHELNNPITPLKVQAHLLVRGALGPLQPVQEEAIQIMERSIARLETLAHDVLDSARVQAGRLRMQPAPVNLATLVEDAYRNHLAQALERGVTLSIESPRRIVAEVDSIRVGQVLSNLVTNAIKFTPPGGHVTLSLSLDGDKAHLRVQDTGAGLSAEQIEQLFQPFSQVHEPAPGRPGGTGLGLYISKGIVDEHGGEIWPTSAGPDGGSTFHVVLPVAAQNTPVTASTPGPKVQARPLRLRSKR